MRAEDGEEDERLKVTTRALKTRSQVLRYGCTCGARDDGPLAGRARLRCQLTYVETNVA